MDRPDVTSPKDWSEVSAPVPVLLAQAFQVPVPQVPVPVERLLAPVPVSVPGQAAEEALVPGRASALGPVPVPGFQPLAAQPWGLRPCAHT